jgi:hypothetical protein
MPRPTVSRVGQPAAYCAKAAASEPFVLGTGSSCPLSPPGASYSACAGQHVLLDSGFQRHSSPNGRIASGL